MFLYKSILFVVVIWELGIEIVELHCWCLKKTVEMKMCLALGVKERDG